MVMIDKLAINGGTPVRARLLPYGRQAVDESDIQAVAEVLRSDWLTTGPRVKEFEKTFAGYLGVGEAVAVSSGTAALHTAMYALDVGPGDEVIVPALTFAASANCVLYQGATPVFADIDDDTLLLDPAEVAAKVTPRTRAVVAVDFAGQPCDYDKLQRVARRHGVSVVADACHAAGASYKNRAVGTLGDLTVFSFHPVKAMTTAEGGMITTESFETAYQMRRFRSHGITFDHVERQQQGSWYYEMVDLGYNYRLSDVQCALGISQLKKLKDWVARRRAIASRYDAAIAGLPGVRPQSVSQEAEHAYHLYVIRLDLDHLSVDRARVFSALRAEGIGVNVHYLPVHLHPYYRQRLGTRAGLCPRAEAAYQEMISLPIFPSMSEKDVEDVIEALWKVINAYATNEQRAAAGNSR
jgi:perosamine synthetase